MNPRESSQQDAAPTAQGSGLSPSWCDSCGQPKNLDARAAEIQRIRKQVADEIRALPFTSKHYKLARDVCAATAYGGLTGQDR